MRVINIIKTKENIVESIDSFGVFEEQLVQDVVDVAEKKFLELVYKELGVTEIDDEEIIDSMLENGYSDMNSGVDMCIIWSDI